MLSQFYYLIFNDNIIIYKVSRVILCLAYQDSLDAVV